MKVILAVVALSVMASSPVAAQQKKGGMSPEQVISNIESTVGSLSAEQKSKINDIVAKSREQWRATPKEERKEKNAAMQKKQRERIRGVLTAEQKKKYDAANKKGAKGGGKKNK